MYFFLLFFVCFRWSFFVVGFALMFNYGFCLWVFLLLEEKAFFVLSDFTF